MDFSRTQKINYLDKIPKSEVRHALNEIYSSLIEKGYNPINQIVGYILSNDPTYITSHKNARAIVTRLDRDEILEELLSFYLNE